MQQNLLINLMNSLGLGINSYITSYSYYAQNYQSFLRVIFKLTIKQNVIQTNYFE